jgi:predicted small lipoprotein YifL
MGQQQKILVKAYALGARAASVLSLCLLASLLNGCGQRGPLTLPEDSEFKQRATLPDIMRRQLPELPAKSPNKSPAAPTPGQPASSPHSPAISR